MEEDKNKNLQEATTDADIATTDEILSVNEIYHEKALASLGRHIFPVIPINGPTAKLFNINTNSGGDGIDLLKSDVAVETSAPIHTTITDEAVQDLYSQFGKEAYNIVGTLLRGLANDAENTATITFLDANCLDGADLALTTAIIANANTSVEIITQRVQELVVESNARNTRTFGAFCVLPYKYAASISAISRFINDDYTNETGLYVGKIGLTDYYINPVVAADHAYVGLKDLQNPSKSAGVFSPYASTITKSLHKDSGLEAYHIFNRYAITASPLNETGNELMHKFEITVT
jgi:hypothetical protein